MQIPIVRAALVLSSLAIVLSGTVGAAAQTTPSPTQRSAAAALHKVPVLGSKNFWPGHYDRGFGRAHPKRIFNGGDPSGIVKRISWKHWGATRAYGWGKTFIFKPRGGYYPKAVRAQLRAKHLGHCTAHSRLAYLHLDVREPRKPGGKLGKWFSWSGAKRLC